MPDIGKLAFVVSMGAVAIILFAAFADPVASALADWLWHLFH